MIYQVLNKVLQRYKCLIDKIGTYLAVQTNEEKHEKKEASPEGGDWQLDYG